MHRWLFVFLVLSLTGNKWNTFVGRLGVSYRPSQSYNRGCPGFYGGAYAQIVTSSTGELNAAMIISITKTYDTCNLSALIS